MKIITDNSITLFDNLVPVTITKEHPCFEEVYSLVLDDFYEEALELMNERTVVSNFLVNSSFYLTEDDEVFMGETQVPEVLAERIKDLMAEDADISYLENFFSNLLENPSYRAVNELYDFLEASKLPITEDGYFIAYKSVREDYTDHHTGKMDNSIGAQPTMPRNTVDEDKNRTCSAGLHFAAYDYAINFGWGNSHLMAVKINPKDVVAIPSDYNNQKGRACTYTIIAEIDDKSDQLSQSAIY